MRVKDFDTAIKLDESNIEAYRFRGAANTSMCNWEAAVSDYTEAIRLDRNRSPYLIECSWGRYKLDDIAGAIDDCNEGIRLTPTDEMGHFLLALYLISPGARHDAKLAVSHARRACELRPKDGAT